jgi:hypothetical protein
MDDIKLYGSSKLQLEHLTKITHTFSEDINMEFGLEKCRTQRITRGKRDPPTGFETNNGCLIEAMEENEVYKYLGFEQARLIEHKNFKQSLTKTYLMRLKSILKTNLCSENTIKAINTYAVPILTYSFGIINWSKTKLEGLQRNTRSTLTDFNQHHLKSCLERTTLPRKDGGRGMIDILNMLQTNQHITNVLL